MIHATIGHGGYSLCRTRWGEDDSGVTFPNNRHKITCPKCLIEVARRVDGTPLSKLSLTARPRNLFQLEQIYTVEYVEEMTDGELLRNPNFGKKSLKEVRDAIRVLWNKDHENLENTAFLRCSTCPHHNGCYPECIRGDDLCQIIELTERCNKIEYENTCLHAENTYLRDQLAKYLPDEIAHMTRIKHDR
jgi:hypothetical protein